MNSPRRRKALRWAWLLPLAWLGAVMAIPRPAGPVGPPVNGETSPDVARVLGPQECAECHVEEFAAWQGSKHELGSKTLTRNEKSREIAKALGIRRVKNDARCTRCHYTVQLHGEKEKAVAGVSCESCHGAAREWIKLHEDPQSLTQCDGVGMKRPGQLYELAARCYVCHTIDDEELVNVGGHPTGEGFELVCYTQGEVLHNYVRGEGKNAAATVERKRALFVVGMLLELEYALRALALAEGPGPHATALAERAGGARTTLGNIDAVVTVDEVAAALSAVAELALEPGDAEALTAAADAVAEAAEAFPADADLAAIDPLLPPPDMVVGSPAD